MKQYYIVYFDVITLGSIFRNIHQLPIVGSLIHYNLSTVSTCIKCQSMDSAHIIVKDELYKYYKLRSLACKELMYNDIINLNMYIIFEDHDQANDHQLSIASVNPYINEFTSTDLTYYIKACEYIEGDYVTTLNQVLGDYHIYYLHNGVQTHYKKCIVLLPTGFKFIMIDTIDDDLDLWDHVNSICSQYNGMLTNGTLHASPIHSKRCVIYFNNVTMIDVFKSHPDILSPLHYQ